MPVVTVGVAADDETASEIKRDAARRHLARFSDEENPMPTNEKEQDQTDLQHEIMLLLLGGKPHKAPLHMPRRIHDIAAGTGSWAVAMADRYPMAEVIGVDLHPIRPSW